MVLFHLAHILFNAHMAVSLYVLEVMSLLFHRAQISYGGNEIRTCRPNWVDRKANI
jgi:hypothetical protein